MEFGKLPAVDDVDFTLRPDPSPVEARLTGWRARRDGPPRVLLGAARWVDRAFVGKLYPRGTKPTEYLARYADQLDSVELNATYYGFDAERMRGWAAAVPDHFRFCAKFPATITHRQRLRDVEPETDAFVDALRGFGAKLGPAWALLPEDFGPRDLPLLERFLDHVGTRVPLAIELRHPAWFADARAHHDVFELLAEHGVGAVLTDVAGRRDVAHMEPTAPTMLVRFVGNRLHPTDLPRLDRWVERLGTWCDNGLHEVHLLLHQPEDHLVVELAEHVGPRLAARLGVPIRSPRREVPPKRQGTLF